MFDRLEAALLSYAETLPLEIFVPLASFLEELIAPIPSPTVMLLAGSITSLQAGSIISLVPLAFLGALGKTAGALVIYFIADKAEDVVMSRFSGYFNVTHEDITRFRAKLGTGLRGYIILTLLRAFPFMPSTVISVGAGLVKIPLPLYTVATFIGTIVRDGFYLYAGYIGTRTYANLIAGSTNIETLIEMTVVVSVLVFVTLRIYAKRARRSHN